MMQQKNQALLQLSQGHGMDNRRDSRTKMLGKRENLLYQFGLSQLLLLVDNSRLSTFEPDTSLHCVALLNGKQTGTSLQTTVRVLKFKEELKEVWF